MIYIGGLIAVLGILIFVHELGHFLAAKAVGIAVLRFSLGLGPKTKLAFRRGETEYCLSWVPFGGYVKMAGLEDEEGTATALEGTREDVEVPPERTFDAKPLGARIFVISAGVAMNALFALLVFSLVAGFYGTTVNPTVTVAEVRGAGLPLGAAPLGTLQRGDRIVRINGDSMTGWQHIVETILTGSAPLRLEVAGRAAPVLVDVPLREQQGRMAVAEALVPLMEPVLGRIRPGLPADSAGLVAGDRVLAVNGDTIETWPDLVRKLSTSPGSTLVLRVERGGDRREVTVIPRGYREGGRTVGRIGVEAPVRVERYGLAGTLRAGVRETGDAFGLVLFTLKGLVLGDLSPRDIGGPILIGQLAGEAARIGLEAFLRLLALISVNLAVLNLLPIPVLDGGHLVFLVAEGVRRKPLSVQLRQRLTQAGLVFLLVLMVLAVFNDVTRSLFR